MALAMTTSLDGAAEPPAALQAASIAAASTRAGTSGERVHRSWRTDDDAPCLVPRGDYSKAMDESIESIFAFWSVEKAVVAGSVRTRSPLPTSTIRSSWLVPPFVSGLSPSLTWKSGSCGRPNSRRSTCRSSSRS